MAKCGVSYLVASKLTETDGVATYEKGMEVAALVSVKTAIETNSATLYANNKLKESVKLFKQGKLTLEIDDLVEDIKAKLLGHTVNVHEGGMTANDPSYTEVTSNEADIAPFFGVGFYGNTLRDGIWGFRAIWMFKTQFSEPADDMSTRGDSISLATTTLENTIYKDDDGNWKTEAFFANEEDAKAWLNTKALITT